MTSDQSVLLELSSQFKSRALHLDNIRIGVTTILGTIVAADLTFMASELQASEARLIASSALLPLGLLFSGISIYYRRDFVYYNYPCRKLMKYAIGSEEYRLRKNLTWDWLQCKMCQSERESGMSFLYQLRSVWLWINVLVGVIVPILLIYWFGCQYLRGSGC